MTGFGYDPDAYLQDADIEMAQLTATADRLARIEADGTCTHGWHQRRADGTVVCNRCGQVWANEEEAHAAFEEYL